MLIIYLCIIVFLLAMSALWSCTETVYTSVSKAWLTEQAAEGNARALKACRLLENADRFLGTILMGNNLVNVSFVTVVRLVITTYLVQVQGVSGILEMLHCSSDVLTTVISTPVVLVFGEIMPKAVGRNFAEPLALKLAELISWLQKLLWPLVWGIVWISRRLVRLLGGGTEGQVKAGGVTRDDIRVLAEMMAEQGMVAREVGGMLQMVLDLENKTVESEMTPLAEVRSVPSVATVAEVERLTMQSGFTRFPVYSGRVDDIVGVVSLRQMQHEQRKLGIDDRTFSESSIASFIQTDVLFVPETKDISSLLEELRHQPVPLAIVVNEYGGMTGMITIEDLAGQVIGNIRNDRVRTSPMVRKLDEHSFECDGKLDIEELEDWLGCSIDNDDFETAAGLVLKISGRIPAVGEFFEYKGFKISILEIHKHRIKKLKFARK